MCSCRDRQHVGSWREEQDDHRLQHQQARWRRSLEEEWWKRRVLRLPGRLQATPDDCTCKDIRMKTMNREGGQTRENSDGVQMRCCREATGDASLNPVDGDLGRRAFLLRMS